MLLDVLATLKRLLLCLATAFLVAGKESRGHLNPCSQGRKARESFTWVLGCFSPLRKGCKEQSGSCLYHRACVLTV